MKRFPAVSALALVLVVGVAASGVATPLSQTAPDTAAMIDRIFAASPQTDPPIAIVRDDAYRAYYAFYMSTYVDVKEVRAYAISFRNVQEVAGSNEVLDDLLGQAQYAEAFDGLLAMMRLDLGSQYVSDVSVDGVHEGDVAVGTGSMRDRFHAQVFADHAAANEAYQKWLSRALELIETE